MARRTTSVARGARLPGLPRSRAPIQRAALATVFIALFGTSIQAQQALVQPIVLEGAETLDFDRPESWAMKYFTSASILSGLGVPRSIDSGSVTLSLEAGHIPTLDEDQRRVGFIGSKVEDLNRTEILGRARLSVGMPRDWTLTVGVVPPLELDGVTPRLLSAAIGRPVVDGERWRLGLRLHGQVGSVEGDLTCPAGLAGLADPLLNPDNCLEPSDDEAVQNYMGLEVSAARRLGNGDWEPYAAVSVNYLDLEFRVDARYGDFLDRVVLRTSGITWSTAAGLAYDAGDGFTLAGEVFFTPLDVVRDPRQGAENDDLLNLRLLLEIGIR